jgi:hypothetical protein
MAGSNNTTSIDSVVDPIAVEQFNQLKASGKELRAELVALLETAIKLNTTLGGSTPATFAKNMQASTEATNKIIANNNKQIENEVKKAAKQEEIYNKYLILLSKQEQARQQAQAKQDAADAKETQKAEQKAAKLAVINDKIIAEQARKDARQFPVGASLEERFPVTQNPGATRIPEEITQNIGLRNQSALATEAETAALLAQKETMDSLSVSYRANIELLLALQSERAANATELKALNVEDAASGERAVFLTAEQLRLSTAISETNLTLSQQTKQINAADTSIAQMQASLNELRVAYNNLTLAERENIEIGAVYLAEIETLDAAVKEAAIAQGIHNKNVGAYTTATEIADKVSAQFVRQLVRMAAQFLLITIIFGAITWLYDFIKGLDVFTGRLDQNKQAWDAWSAVMKEGNKNAAEQLVKLDELNKAAQDNNLTEKERIKAAETMKELWPDKLKNLSDESIMNGTVKKSIDEVTASIEKQALAQAGLSKLTEIAEKELDLKTQRDKLNYAKASNLNATDKGNGFDRLSFLQQLAVSQSGIPSKSDLKKIFKNDIDKQQADINAQLAVQANNRKVIEDNIGIGALAGAAEGKPKKPGATKDTANTDLLEKQRIAIEAAKKASQAILDNDNQSYGVKIAALAAYQSQSKQLIDVAEEIALADTNLREQQRKNIIEKFRLEGLDVDHEIAVKKERLDKDVLEKHKRTLVELITADKEVQQQQLEDLNQGAIVAAQVLQNQHDKALDLLNDRYDKGLISEKEYNRAILAENDDYAIKRLKAELVVQEAILAIKVATRDKELLEAKAKGATPEELAKIKGDANKGIDTTNNSIGSITGQLTEAEIKAKRDGTTGKVKTAAEKKQETIDGLQEVSGLIGDISSLSNSLYDAEISKLEKKGELIQQNAKIESDAINNSLDTQANKARRQQVLDAQTASQQKAIAQQIAAEKTKQARADKVAAIAEIILNTAIAAISAPAKLGPFGLALVPTILALGAINLAKAVATPIPQFAKGTPTGGHKGGYAIVGDGGGPERITEPGKMAYYSPSVATMVDLPRGTVVEPYTMLPKTPKWESNGTGAAQVVNVKIDQPKQKQPRLMGWVEAQRQADSWGRYSGNYFK